MTLRFRRARRAIGIAAPFVAASLHAQPLHAQPITPKANRSSAMSAVKHHQDVWRGEWKNSEFERRDAHNPRALFWHCHAEDVKTDRKNPHVIQYHQRIPSLYGAFAVCPSWLLDDEPVVRDERLEVDAPISESRRAKVQASRASLVAALRDAALRVPTDAVIAGQLVRFLLEQSRTDEALVAANNCEATGWRCHALVGLVESHRQHFVAAGRAFAAARAAMSTQQRCEWDDIVALLPRGERARYAKETCVRRETINDRYWWLSDPLYSDPGNERQVIDDERKMITIVRSDAVRDERFDWQVRSGGDAMTELVLRYGWPSYVAWGGIGEDENHGSYLAMYGSRVRPPYTTFEYMHGRIHTAPAWDVMNSPFSATVSSWQLNEPRDSSDVIWWPEEHFARPRPLLQLVHGQTALFRRQDHIVLASAHALSAAQLDSLGGATTATLVTTTGPSQLTVVDTRALRDDRTAMMRGLMDDSVSVITSMEIRGDGDQSADARIRFAITPPTALRSLLPGETALSDPILTRVPSDADDLSTLGESLIDEMLGSTTLPRGTRKVGIYWESYGFQVEDSVRIAVRIDRHNDSGFLKRFAVAMNLARDPAYGLEISWREPDVAHRVRTVAGSIQSRALVLDIGTLVPGQYELTVSVTKRTGEPMFSSRVFDIR